MENYWILRNVSRLVERRTIRTSKIRKNSECGLHIRSNWLFIDASQHFADNRPVSSSQHCAGCAVRTQPVMIYPRSRFPFTKVGSLWHNIHRRISFRGWNLRMMPTAASLRHQEENSNAKKRDVELLLFQIEKRRTSKQMSILSWNERQSITWLISQWHVLRNYQSTQQYV